MTDLQAAAINFDEQLMFEICARALNDPMEEDDYRTIVGYYETITEGVADRKIGQDVLKFLAMAPHTYDAVAQAIAYSLVRYELMNQ